jgi:hypothetical protein
MGRRYETSALSEVESVMGWLVEEQVRWRDARRIRDYIVITLSNFPIGSKWSPKPSER